MVAGDRTGPHLCQLVNPSMRALMSAYSRTMIDRNVRQDLSSPMVAFRVCVYERALRRGKCTNGRICESMFSVRSTDAVGRSAPP